jgi:DNA-binding Xre family transcriptional regulator
MKLEINERICDGMNSKKRITASYLRDQKGLTRTETDGLCKEGTELSLKTLYILAQELDTEVEDIIASPGELMANLPFASEPSVGSDKSIYHVLKPLSVEEIKSEYLKAELCLLEDDWFRDIDADSRVIKEKASLAGNDILKSKVSWISKVEPNLIAKHGATFKELASELERYADLKIKERTQHQSLEQLISNAEEIIEYASNSTDSKGGSWNKKLTTEFCVFYKAIVRPLAITELSIGNRLGLEPNVDLDFQYQRKPYYQFEVKPLVCHHFFIIAPPGTEYFGLYRNPEFIERNIFSISDGERGGPKYVGEDYWWDYALDESPEEIKRKLAKLALARAVDDEDDIPF